MPPLEDFIKEHEPLVKLIIRKSKYSSILDSFDHNELIYMGLWKVYKNYDPSKSSIKTFINLVIRQQIIDIYRSKLSYSLKNIPLTTEHCYTQTDIKDNFTDEEWELVEPRVNNNTIIESATQSGMSKFKYKKQLIRLEQRVKNRNKK